MLQWTQEGEELLMKARRYHNGAIECFKRKDYMQSKRFLQNALKGRRMALPLSHPLILGTIEMMTIVSQVAHTAHLPGGTISSTLMTTASRRVGATDATLFEGDDEDDDNDPQNRDIGSVSVSDPSSLSDSSSVEESDDGDSRLSELERRKRRSAVVAKQQERAQRREEKLWKKKRDKLHMLMREAGLKAQFQSSTTGATPLSLLKMKQSGSEADRRRLDTASESFTLFTDPSGKTIDPCTVEQTINNHELRMLLEELVDLQGRRLGMYHVETEATLTRLWRVLRELGETDEAAVVSDRVWKMRCMSQAERRGEDFDHVLSNLAIGGDNINDTQSTTSRNWHRSANVIKDHYMVRPLNAYHSGILERFDKYEEVLKRKLGLADLTPEDEEIGHQMAIADDEKLGSTSAAEEEELTPASHKLSKRDWYHQIDDMSPLDVFRVLVPEGSEYDGKKTKAVEEFIQLQMAELPPAPPEQLEEEEESLLPPTPLGNTDDESGVFLAPQPTTENAEPTHDQTTGEAAPTQDQTTRKAAPTHDQTIGEAAPTLEPAVEEPLEPSLDMTARDQPEPADSTTPNEAHDDPLQRSVTGSPLPAAEDPQQVSHEQQPEGAFADPALGLGEPIQSTNASGRDNGATAASPLLKAEEPAERAFSETSSVGGLPPPSEAPTSMAPSLMNSPRDL